MPLSAATLHGLYPTHAAYVRTMTRAIGRCVRTGWLRPYDATDLLVRANAERLG